MPAGAGAGPPRPGVGIGAVSDGAAATPPPVGAPYDAGIQVESLDLMEPTLDDVFVEKTGHHLEGEETEDGEPSTGEESAVADEPT